MTCHQQLFARLHENCLLQHFKDIFFEALKKDRAQPGIEPGTSRNRA